MENIYNEHYTGERALFNVKDLSITDTLFDDGESPLKESKNLRIIHCTFGWKYPLWYDEDVVVNNSTWNDKARAGVWYTKNIKVINCQIDGPKNFRKSKGIDIQNTDFSNALETLWNCEDVHLESVTVKNGPYFGMNLVNGKINSLDLEGNYAFDGAKNLLITNSTLMSKDAFWNSENITCINCKIIGEYFAWNSKNLTLIDCEIDSLQGFCYIDQLKLINCKLMDTSLSFEYCTNIDADVNSRIKSVKNPTSGVIRSLGIDELILDENQAEPNNVQFIDKNEEYQYKYEI